MSIRQGYFRIGETVEISAEFFDSQGVAMNATGITLYIRKPNEVLEEFALTSIDGVIATDVAANMAGLWRVRVECDGPTPTATESKFYVVESTVL